MLAARMQHTVWLGHTSTGGADQAQQHGDLRPLEEVALGIHT